MKWILASAMPSLCSTPRHRRYEGVIHNAALWETSTPCGGDYNAALWGNSWAFFVGRTMNIITYQHWPLAIDQYTNKCRKKHRIIRLDPLLPLPIGNPCLEATTGTYILHVRFFLFGHFRTMCTSLLETRLSLGFTRACVADPSLHWAQE